MYISERNVKTNKMKYQTKNFKELKNLHKMDDCLLAMLDILRETYGEPIIVTSGYRTKEENKRVGGVENSSHLTGNAVDIRVKDSRDRFYLIKLALSAGFTRIGVGKNFLHLDNDIHRKDPCVIWTY